MASITAPMPACCLQTQLVNKSIESVENIALQKRRNLEQIIQVMQYKINQINQEGGQGK